MSNDVKLELCPFCGGPAQIIAGAPGCYYVRCEGCSVTSDDGSRERVITKWNTRHQPQEREAVLDEVLSQHGLVLTDDPDFDHDEQTFEKAKASFVASLTTPATAVSRDDQALFDDICAKMEEVVAPLPGSIAESLAQIERHRASLPPEERARIEREEIQAQRESWVRAMAPCEHGDPDWETCAQCRGEE